MGPNLSIQSFIHLGFDLLCPKVNSIVKAVPLNKLWKEFQETG